MERLTTAVAIIALLLFSVAMKLRADVETKEPPIREEVAQSDTLEGVYEVHGTVGEHSYVGTALITRQPDSVHRVQYIVGLTYTVGAGKLNGETLTVGWQNGPVQGITQYKVRGKVLNGNFGGVPHIGRHKEELRWIANLPKEDEE